MSELNKDVVAGDILRTAYRRQMDEHARAAKRVASLREELELAVADQRTAADRATSIMETLARYGGMLPPAQSDSRRMAETTGSGRSPTSGVGEADAPKS